MEDLDRAEHEVLSRVLDEMPVGADVFVAECGPPAVTVAGVAYVETATDYFTREQHGHLSILSVAEGAEGRGVGRALLDTVERWASARGFRFLTLNVFSGNDRARRIYERAGYAPDTIRYAKVIAPNALPPYLGT